MWLFRNHVKLIIFVRCRTRMWIRARLTFWQSTLLLCSMIVVVIKPWNNKYLLSQTISLNIKVGVPFSLAVAVTAKLPHLQWYEVLPYLTMGASMEMLELGKVPKKFWDENQNREVYGDGLQHHGFFPVSILRGNTTGKVVSKLMLHPSIETRIVYQLF